MAFVALVVALLGPAVALAHRAPTERERRAIARKAAAADGSPTQRVRVRRIVVSTVGPWATGVVSVYLRSAPKQAEQVSQETFYRSQGRWLDTNGTGAPRRSPPGAVISDLRLPTQPAGGHNTRTGLLILAAVAAALAAVAVLYRIRHPPAPGTTPPRQPPLRQSRQKTRQAPPAGPPPPRKCSFCDGKGKRRCSNNCTNIGGQFRSHVSSNPEVWLPCGTCVGTGEVMCDPCHGTGVASSYG